MDKILIIYFDLHIVQPFLNLFTQESHFFLMELPVKLKEMLMFHSFINNFCVITTSWRN